jgi:hypothetical protein
MFENVLVVAMGIVRPLRGGYVLGFSLILSVSNEQATLD